MKAQPYKIYRMPQKQFLEVHSDTGLPQKKKKKNLKIDLTPKIIIKRTNKTLSQQKGGNDKDQRGNQREI